MRRQLQHRNKKFLQYLGASVRTYRVDRLLSQEELGTLCGLHRTYITDIESGYRNLSVLTALKVAGGLDIALSALISHAEGEDLKGDEVPS